MINDVAGRGGARFRHRDGREATSLEALVSDRSLVDAEAIAERAVMLPPLRADDTPWSEVTAHFGPVARPPLAASPPRAEESATGFVRDAMTRAVARTLEGARRVAVMTGGGLDSAGLLALAVEWARTNGGEVFAVALDFAGEGDDRPHMRALEKHLGCRVVRVRPEETGRRFELFRTGVDGAPLPWATAPFEVEVLARAKDEGADCILCGAGGDELFDGIPTSLAGYTRRGRLLHAASSARAMRGFGTRPRHRIWDWTVRPLLVDAIPRLLRRWRPRRPAVPSPWMGPVLADVWVRSHRSFLERALAAQRTPTERFDWFRANPGRLYYAWSRHQCEVAAGIERRDPFLDPTLVAEISALPPEWLLAGARRRGLFREALHGLVPDSVRYRDDKARFEPAVKATLDAAGGPSVLREWADGRELAALGIVEGPRFRAECERFFDAPDEMDWVTFWPALACEAFLRHRRR